MEEKKKKETKGGSAEKKYWNKECVSKKEREMQRLREEKS